MSKSNSDIQTASTHTKPKPPKKKKSKRFLRNALCLGKGDEHESDNSACIDEPSEVEPSDDSYHHISSAHTGSSSSNQTENQ